MARRFETQYKTKRNDNLGDPDWHNRRWDDIDRRMHARELDATKIDDAVDTLEAAALARLNDQLTPIIAQAITRLTDFGLLFSATSHTERTIQTGNIEFTVDPAVRESFVATGFLILRPTENLAVGMSARTLSYNPATGLLVVDAYSVIGSGTYDDWQIGVTGDPDLAHATRTDNPHATTAAQVGAYTTAQADSAINGAVAAEAMARTTAINAAIASLVGSAPSALNTLQELAAALANDSSFAATITTALASRIRFDEAQVLSQAEKDQALANIGAWTTGDAKLTLKTSADAGWVLANDGTIGDATSGASTRANADCQALFTLLFNNVADANAPLLTSGGAPTTRAAQGSAGVAWAAHCRMTLTKQLGRGIAIAGAGAGLTVRPLGAADGAEATAINASQLAPHTHGLPDGMLLNLDGAADIASGGIYYRPQARNGSVGLGTGSVGSGATFSIMNPRAYWNVMIKL